MLQKNTFALIVNVTDMNSCKNVIRNCVSMYVSLKY